jgi:FKBP-type peptidyl-prolyl cis-trans isomerase
MKKLLTVCASLFLFIGLTGCQKNKLPQNSTIQDSQNTELVVEILRSGDGEIAKEGDFVVVHYTGTLVDGTQFDSSRKNGKPFPFTLGKGQVISGWDQGIVGMKVGEIRRLTIPPRFAYGEKGIGPIPGNATLVFEVELLEIKSWEDVLRGGTHK